MEVWLSPKLHCQLLAFNEASVNDTVLLFIAEVNAACAVSQIVMLFVRVSLLQKLDTISVTEYVPGAV